MKSEDVKTPEKPRLFVLWDQIMNKEEGKEKK
jgi:hypothetical protein